MKPGYADGLGRVIKVPESYGAAPVGSEELGPSRVPAGCEKGTKVILFFERTEDCFGLPS